MKLLNFITQFEALVKAKLPIHKSLEIISQKNNHDLIILLSWIKKGNSISQAINQQFNLSKLHLSILEIYEQNGELLVGIQQLNKSLKQQLKLKKDILNAIIYPAFTLLSLIITFTLFTIYIIPIFKELYIANGCSLPWLTSALIAIPDYFEVIIISILAVYLGIVLFNKFYRIYSNKLILSIPGIGPFIIINHLCNITDLLITQQQAGITLPQCISNIASTIYNLHIKQILIEIKNNLNSGESLSQIIHKYKYLGIENIALLQIAEENGNMLDTLATIKNNYQEILQDKIHKINLYLEPVLLGIISICVGIILVGFYLPIFNISNVI